jgi:hypothetical protein
MNSDGSNMELEGLNASSLTELSNDVETIESWADRNGISYGVARAWAMRGVIPTVKIGKRRMINCVQFRQWLIEQEWVA